MAKSIIQAYTDKENRECFLCRLNSSANLPHRGLEKHHFIHGTANRKLAEHWGLWGYLCQMHHYEIHNSDREKDLFLMHSNCHVPNIWLLSKHYSYHSTQLLVIVF